jgi:hypothetical protein
MSKRKRPVIDDTSFGSISVDGVPYDHDIIITLEGKVKKRKKKLSKSVYGTSHTLSLPEIEYVYQEEAKAIIIGSGQYGVTRLSEEALSFLAERGCPVSIQSTPEAIMEWNSLDGKQIGLFHITC